jgi:sensor c-di-GMP phosphodiesterase-like protein
VKRKTREKTKTKDATKKNMGTRLRWRGSCYQQGWLFAQALHRPPYL